MEGPATSDLIMQVRARVGQRRRFIDEKYVRQALTAVVVTDTLRRVDADIVNTWNDSKLFCIRACTAAIVTNFLPPRTYNETITACNRGDPVLDDSNITLRVTIT